MEIIIFSVYHAKIIPALWEGVLRKLTEETVYKTLLSAGLQDIT